MFLNEQQEDDMFLNEQLGLEWVGAFIKTNDIGGLIDVAEYIDDAYHLADVLDEYAINAEEEYNYG